MHFYKNLIFLVLLAGCATKEVKQEFPQGRYVNPSPSKTISTFSAPGAPAAPMVKNFYSTNAIPGTASTPVSAPFVVTNSASSGVGATIFGNVTLPFGVVRGTNSPAGVAPFTLPITDVNTNLVSLANQANSVLVNNGTTPSYLANVAGGIKLELRTVGVTTQSFYFSTYGTLTNQTSP